VTKVKDKQTEHHRISRKTRCSWQSTCSTGNVGRTADILLNTLSHKHEQPKLAMAHFTDSTRQQL